MIVVVASVGLALLALPWLSHRAGRGLSPAHWARLCTFALVAGAMLFEGSTLLAAAPPVLLAVGLASAAHACQAMFGHMYPAGVPFEAAAGLVAVLLPLLAWHAVARARRVASRAQIEASLGEHRGLHQEFELVVLPLAQHIAVGVPGEPGQLIVSRRTVQDLSTDQFLAVCDHEAAHLRFSHALYIQLGLAVEETFRFWPPAAKSVAVLRLALERWADEAATGRSAPKRASLRSALLTIIKTEVAEELAALSSADGLFERVDALERMPSGSPVTQWCVVLLSSSLLAATAGIGVVWWMAQAFCVARMVSAT